MTTGKYKVRQDKRLHVDFELTCPDDDAPLTVPFEPEIIEMGVAELDLQLLEIGRRDSYYIKNEYSPVTKRCTELTGITQKILDKQGRPLSEVFASFSKKYGPGNKAWIAWGSDKEAVDRDCLRKSVRSPFSEAFFNMGLEFSQMTGLGRSIGLHDALRILGEQPITEHHRAVNDAIESARVDIFRIKRMRAVVDLTYFEEPSQSFKP
ncbi:3'-5' exonuclease [Rhizobium sp. MHM7A]|uniref:3'-5' exonuclease n=1 Tax=Rhizobium sp. MHM7A TaxID=2583233 RepID=UPI001106A3F5|nr:3'-5' exonuclease [Rhizobium sp. MHM7A]TLX16881.1 exonuclease domain-containing protein [Rhizobium sp. MHM7A]